MSSGKKQSRGKVEITQEGGSVVLRNNMGPLSYKLLMFCAKKRRPVLKRQIERLILRIRKSVAKCDPVELLGFTANVFLKSNSRIQSEIQLTSDEIYTSRATEYIQSVLVSTKSEYTPTKGKWLDPSVKYFSILRDTKKLYKLVMRFYFTWVADIKDKDVELDEETKKLLIEAQLFFLVRGHRYQIFEREYYQKLLMVHDDIFREQFGMSEQHLLDGIVAIQYALSQGKVKALNRFGELHERVSRKGSGSDVLLSEEEKLEYRECYDKSFGTQLHDVIKVTGWPERFVRSLSFEINENSEFFNESEFSGWPIIDLPIQKRPFIAVDGRYYCFDYYTFVDYFYRAIQKAVSRTVPGYNWSDMQKEASEQMVAEIFSEILPGSTIYRDNYYPKKTSLKQLNENDLIVVYSDALLIVEVKAGSFVFTAPITDFEHHITSYKNLIEKADHQCKNTYDYLSSKTKPTLHNSDGSEKAEIDMSKISDVFMISVTIDNINEFAAKAEKLNFLNLKCNAISLSVDDLMVYRSYFDSPLTFLHFLSQRRQATQEKKLALNDELDHLGLYIEHNMYCVELSKYPENTEIVFEGYREEVDTYFGQLFHPELKPEKPKQNHPEIIHQILTYLVDNNVENRVEIANYFLNFSSEAKEGLNDTVLYLLRRQREIKRMVPVSTGVEQNGNGLRYTLFVTQPGINVLSESEKLNYTLSTLVWNNDPERIMIKLAYDRKGKFESLQYHKYKREDIPNMRVEDLKKEGQERAKIRVAMYLRQHGVVDDNEYCPCASGRRFVDCCKSFIDAP